MLTSCYALTARVKPLINVNIVADFHTRKSSKSIYFSTYAFAPQTNGGLGDLRKVNAYCLVAVAAIAVFDKR